MTARNRLLSHCGTAFIAALAASLATYGATTLVGPSAAQIEAATRRVDVMAQPLSDLPGREVRIRYIDLAPADHDFGYIIDGTYEWKIGDGPTKVFKAGDAFYEPPGVLHAVSKNASASSRAKFVVFMVADTKQPSTVVEPK